MLDITRVSLRSAVAFTLVALAATLGVAAGCGNDNSSTTSGTNCDAVAIQPGDDCATLCTQKGGVVIDGACAPKCQDSDCVAGNICVNNACALQCATYKDCILGQQDCLGATADSTKKAVTVCQTSNKAAFGSPCPFGTECTTNGLNACDNGDQCSYTQCGGGACTLNKLACLGIDKCTIGACADGSPCRIPGCSQSECKPLVCISKGSGDANAYCSKQDCNADTDCASAFYCGVTRDPNPICDPSAPTKEKGGSTFCGATSTMTTDLSSYQTCLAACQPNDSACVTMCATSNPAGAKCIDSSTFSDNGETYFEGSLCLLRKTCIQRTECAPCDNDAECGNLVGGKCITIGPDKRCTVACASNTDCQTDSECTAGFCIPRYTGGCIGTGKFCEPCLNDTDCGDANSHFGCNSNSTGQLACVDFGFSSKCTTDTDCPLSPSGKHGHCLGTSDIDGVTSTDSVYHTCYLVLDPVASRFGCW